MKLHSLIALLLPLSVAACGPTVGVTSAAAGAGGHLPGTGGAGGGSETTSAGTGGQGGSGPAGIPCASGADCLPFAACRAYACTDGECVFSDPLDGVVTCGSTMCVGDADCTTSVCSATTCDAGVCTYHDSGSADPLCQPIPPAGVKH